MKKNILTALLVTAGALLAGIGIGSVNISINEIFSIIGNQLFGRVLPADMDMIKVSIFMQIRLPRVLTAFCVGGLLSLSGAIMQAVLQNPLASSYTLGVSSGASLGAAIIIAAGINLPFILPAGSFVTGMLGVIAALGIASLIDRSSGNHTIILIGMIFSLFANAVMTLISSLFNESSRQIILWLMGSFSSRGWTCVWILLPALLAAVILSGFFHRELDVLTFGEEQALTMGVEVKKIKWILLSLATAYTAAAVCFTGVIGFVDLVVPHAVRRMAGPAHKQLLPLCALYGGSFMVLADLIARTVISPREIPIGAMTALIGAPAFAYICFRRGGRKWK